MFCKNCGNEVENAQYCSICGAPLDTDVTIEDVSPAYENVGDAIPDAPVATEDPGKGLGTAALILGIVSSVMAVFCSCCYSCSNIVPLLSGIVGIILGAIASKNSKTAGFANNNAKIGMILSILAVVLIVIFYVVMICLYGFAFAAAGISSIMQY